MFWQNGDLWKDTQLLTTRTRQVAVKYPECAPEVWLEPSLCKRPSETMCQPSCWNMLRSFCFIFYDRKDATSKLYLNEVLHTFLFTMFKTKQKPNTFLMTVFHWHHIVRHNFTLWRCSVAHLSRRGLPFYSARHATALCSVVRFCNMMLRFSQPRVHRVDSLNSVGL